MSCPGCTVVIPTWNSDRTLQTCIDRIYLHFPQAKIIIVDKMSTDDTRDIAQKNSCSLLDDDCSLGSARMAGVRAADTEWIAFIDDDVFIMDDFSALFDYVDETTGAVQGIAIGPETIGITRDDKVRELTEAERGYTNLTIVRRELVIDLDISMMNAYEDWAISRHIINKGYRWKVVPIYGLHMYDTSMSFYKSAWNTYGLFVMHSSGFLPFGQLMAHYAHRILGQWISFLSVPRKSLNDLRPLLGSFFWPMHPIMRPKR